MSVICSDSFTHVNLRNFIKQSLEYVTILKSYPTEGTYSIQIHDLGYVVRNSQGLQHLAINNAWDER